MSQSCENKDAEGSTVRIEVSGSPDSQIVIKNFDSRDRLLLYKFMEEKFAAALCEQGSIRIGTLHYYRDMELHSGSSGVLDVGEGTAKFNDGTAPAGTVLSSVITGPSDEPDRYIFCTTSSNAWAASAAESYDTCVEIFEPGNFRAEIRRILRERVDASIETSGGFVAYRTRELSRATHMGVTFTNAPMGIALIKPKEYSVQHEFRMCFPGAKPTAKHLDIDSSELKKYCRIIKRRQQERPETREQIKNANGRMQFDIKLMEKAKRDGSYKPGNPDFEYSLWVTEKHLKDPRPGMINPSGVVGPGTI